MSHHRRGWDPLNCGQVRVRAIPEAGRAHSISTTGSVIEAVTTLHKMMGTNEDRASAGPTLADISGPWL